MLSDLLSNMSMKDINTIRRENLLRLLKEAGTQERLAERCEVSHIYLNQIKNMRPDPTTGKIRNVGNQLARKLEKGMGKPQGWMDTDHSEKHSAAKSQNGAWPFDTLSFEKIIKLTHDERVQLETAVLLSAAQLGLDVKAEGSIEQQVPAKAAKALGS
jgi:transcriptional regulator with XRE-family HTH domain